jgi:hypothetical protein
MKPRIDGTAFGSITIDDTVYEKDVVIRLDGEVKKRKKKLSSDIYGTSHTVSLDEAKHIHQEGAEHLIVGTGQFGYLGLSPEAADYLAGKGCAVTLLPTGAAIGAWNQAEGAAIAMFHITC